MTTNTMVALYSTTLVSSASTVTIGSGLTIPQTYTDLMLVVSAGETTSNGSYTITINSDTGNNYSYTQMYGTGSSAGSSRTSNDSTMYIFGVGYGSNTYGTSIVQFQNYANSSIYRTVLSRGSVAGSTVVARVGLWRNTSNGIKQLDITASGTSFTAGSTFTLYGIANADIGAYATGGVITQDANYYYHAFGNSSYFTPTRNLTADILVVAGGGSGGGGAAGGGAGGVIYRSGWSLTNGTAYTCTVGAGGPSGGSASAQGNNGSDSFFSSMQAFGGGGGGAAVGSSAKNGLSGGSGGGGSGAASNPAGTGGSSTQTSNNGGTGYGNAGGAGVYPSPYDSGSGGGAGAAGNNGSSGNQNGGAGLSNWSSWLQAAGLGQNVNGTYYIAGGGGSSGGIDANGIGGLGGGGNAGVYIGSTPYAGSAGLANSGGGGGGGNGAGVGAAGGAGGSGLVIVRYAK